MKKEQEAALGCFQQCSYRDADAEITNPEPGRMRCYRFQESADA